MLATPPTWTPFPQGVATPDPVQSQQPVSVPTPESVRLDRGLAP